MNFITGICIACISAFSVLGYSIEGISPTADDKNSGAVDECAPIVTRDDVQVLNDLAKNSTTYLTGKAKLSHKQVVAFQHLSEESGKCKVLIMTLINQPEALLEVMETLAEEQSPNAPIPAQVHAIRRIEIDLSGLTPPEKQAIGEVSSSTPSSTSFKKITELEWQALQKYITLATKIGGLTGFSNLERSRVLRVVAENIDNGFSIDDLEVLQKAQLRALGFTEEEIGRLSFLANQKDLDIQLIPEEIATLKKWIEIESMPKSIDLMEFIELAGIHQLIQSLPNPPFTPSELAIDRKFFLRQLENAPLVDTPIVSGLIDLADNISNYLGDNKIFTPFQEMILRHFMLSTLQFGRLPGVDPDHIGSLFQLISLRVELQSMMHSLNKARYIELVITGFSEAQEKLLSQVAKRAFSEKEMPLTKPEVVQLKLYITQARKPGGLNGFGIQERVALFFVIQDQVNAKKSGFRSADLEILRRVEFMNNGFSNAEMHQLGQIVQQGKQVQDLSPEELALLKTLLQVEKVIGPGILISTVESSFLNKVAKSAELREIKNQKQAEEKHQSEQATQQRLEQRRNQNFNQGRRAQSAQVPGVSVERSVSPRD